MIDKTNDIFMAPRAIVLDNEALRILQMAGLAEGSFATCAIPEVRMQSPLFGQYARAKTARQIDGHPALVTFHQPELERVLRAQLRRHPSVTASPGTELLGFSENKGGVQARLRGADGREATVQARFIVGADGASSTVRKLAGMQFDGKSFSQDWLVVDAIGVPEKIDHIAFTCDPRRPSPRMPAPGDRQRWEFMLRPGETRAQMEDPAMVRSLLAPWCDASACHIERTAVYRFHARMVKRFSQGSVFLAGDAAHITPPFVGQGLCAGLRDVSNLSWKLAWVIQGRAAPALLNSYDVERRPHAGAIIRMARMMGALVMPRNRLAAFFVHGTMGLLNRLPVTRALFEELKIKPANVFGRGAFRPGRGRSNLVRGGQLPQGLVRRCADGTLCQSDDHLGDALSLVGFGCDPAAGLSAELRAAWSAAGGRCLTIGHRGQPGLGALDCEDMTDCLVPNAAPVGWIAAVRPDRVVLHDGLVTQAEAIVRQALALLGLPVKATAEV